MTAAMLAAGFADPVHDAQQVFRAVMMGLAEPGRLQTIDRLPEAPRPLSGAAAAVALALADHETALWLDGPLAASADVAAYLRFHTGAKLVTDPAEAAFALIAEPARLLPLERFAQGSAEYPDRSTTLILQLTAFGTGPSFTLSGPGIAGTTRFAAEPLPADFALRLARNRVLFPCGVDLVLTAGREVVGLPRTTRLSQ